MSKELAQTVRSKKLVALAAILAAFAVFATLGSHWQGAKATVTAATFTSEVNSAGLDAADAKTVTGGDIVHLRLTATNNNASETLVINADPHLTITAYTCASGTLSTLGNSVTCIHGVGAAQLDVTATVQAQANNAANIAMSNTASASDADGAFALGAGTGDTITETLVTPNLSAAKTVSAGTIAVGASGSYTITISNADAVMTGNGVSFTDTLDTHLNISSVTTTSGTGSCTGVANVASCTGLTVPAGAPGTITVTINFVVGTNLANGATVANPVVTFSATNISDTFATGGAVNFTATAVSHLTIQKVVSKSPVSYSPLELFNYTIIATNDGQTPLTNVVITDTAPAGVTFNSVAGGGCSVVSLAAGCNVGGLASGSSISITVEAQLNSGLANGASATNSVSAVATEIVVPVLGSVDVSRGDAPALNIIKTGPATAVAGSTASYTVNINNNGGGAATVSVDDTLPAGFTVAGGGCTGTLTFTNNTTFARCAGSLAGGAASVMTVVVYVPVTTPGGTVFTNLATLFTPTPAMTSSVTTTVLAPKLAITKTSSGTVNPSASSGSFTVTVTNSGTSDANNVILKDVVPAALVVDSVSGGGCTPSSIASVSGCNVGTIGAGASVIVTINVHALASTANGTVVVNTATAIGDAPINNTVAATANLTVQNGQLAITKTNNPQTIQPGGVVTSTITVTNVGTYSVAGVFITDVLPAGSVFQTIGSTAGCSAAGTTVTCSAVGLIPSQSFVWTVKFTAPANPGAYNNTATTSNGSSIGNVSAQAPFSVASGQAAEIRHMADNGGPVTGAWSQDVPSNVRGSRHTICAVVQNSGLGYKLADLRVSIGAGDTTVYVQNVNVPAAPDNGTQFQVGDTIRIDSESMYVTAVAGPDVNGMVTLTVVRGVGGSTAAAHTGSGTTYADTAGADVSTTHPLQLPINNLSQISVNAGGGWMALTDADPTVTDPRIFVGDGTATGLPASTVSAGLQGATCVSWVSTEAGDQEITLLYTALDGVTPLQAAWDTDADANDNVDGTVNTLNRALIKEWNVLEDSCVTLSGGVSLASTCFVTSTTGTTATDTTATAAQKTLNVNVSAVFNPANSRYDFTDITITDVFRGRHVMRTGVTWGPANLAGVIWTNVGLTAGSCGAISNTNAGTVGWTTLLNNSTVGNPGVTVFTPDSGISCNYGSWAEITFTGQEPGPLGSGNGVTVTEKVRINVVVPPLPTKQVFLAWAGQRIVLEHDWRLLPGDRDGNYDGDSSDPDPDNIGACPFTPSLFTVDYIKGSGPGNFLAGLGAHINGSDEAWVEVSTNAVQSDGLIPSAPQGSCISRVLYESEDEGQVDVEAFATPVQDPLNQTKIAFVVYYMKLESVNVSLVKDVSKPTHNLSVYAYADYSPGNPWDASKDVTTVDWNVSKDLLVRARVKGWFHTSNPSGRAAGTDSNGSVLPAGRWVMPDDWPLLAGGPGDAKGLDEGKVNAGLAETYRPEFDIMIAPWNSALRGLGTPEGNIYDFKTTTLAQAASSTATTIYVASNSNIVPFATCLLIDSEYLLVTGLGAYTNPGGYALTVAGPQAGAPCPANASVAAAHAAGAVVSIITIVSMPFEGPYSLLDSRSLTAPSAALSDYDPNNVRKTMWPDGDVSAWDAPMPPSLLTVSIRGAGFIKQVLKESVYYLGAANSSSQTFPNPYYIADIPDSPFIPAVVAGGGYFWDTFGIDGPGCINTAFAYDCTSPQADGDGVYRFWRPVIVGTNMWGVGDSSLTTNELAELTYIRGAYGDGTIARDLVIYTDNHGEGMVTANGDFKLDYSGCATNALAGGKHCKPGDKVGASTITAVADYPDFRGKHYPLLSNVATVNWTWGGYKDVTVEPDPANEQYKYIVFHAMDRDGFCYSLAGGVLLHPVLSLSTNDTYSFTGTSTVTRPAETVDFMIDSGDGVIINTSGGSGSVITTYGGSRTSAMGLLTFSTYVNDPASTGVLEFPLSKLAATGAVDECQAWIKVSNSLLGVTDVLAIAHDDEGDIGFDKIVDLQSTMSYSLNFRWSLITWAGGDGMKPADALKGSGGSTNDITSSVTAVYGWDAAAQSWLGYFPAGVAVPGANDLTKLTLGNAYWVAITGPASVTWTIATHVN